MEIPDALHVASAMAGKAELFVTTDDRLIKKMRKVGGLSVRVQTKVLDELKAPLPLRERGWGEG